MGFLLEALQEKMALEFLANTIRGTEWEGHVLLAGGAIRDELMGNDVKDIDLVVDAPDGGIEFANWICKLLGIYSQANPVTFPRFGTAKFNLRGINHNGVDLSKIDIECVMPRTEKYTDGSRKPDVEHGTLQQDAERRDFTVNSLMKDLSTGEIKDLTGMGRADIKSGIVRSAIDPNYIFNEDPLRMLRAIRFAVKYNWKLPYFMIKAIVKNASQLERISAERIQDELNKMLVSNNPHKAIKLMRITGLLKFIMPEFLALRKLTQNKHHIHSVEDHTYEVLKGVPPNIETRLAALFHDAGKAATKSVIDNEVHFYDHESVSAELAKEIMTRLKYPTDVINAVYVAVKNHMRLKQSGLEGEKISDKALRKLQNDLGPHLQMTLDLMHSDNSSHSDASSMPNQIPGIRNRLSTLKMPDNNKIVLPINGNDIMKQLGLKPGPTIKVLLDIVKDAWFENPNLTKEEAFALVNKEYEKMQ